MGAPDMTYVEDAACYVIQGLLANTGYLGSMMDRIPDATKRTREIVDDAFLIATMMEEKRRQVADAMSRPVRR